MSCLSFLVPPKRPMRESYSIEHQETAHSKLEMNKKLESRAHTHDYFIHFQKLLLTDMMTTVGYIHIQ